MRLAAHLLAFAMLMVWAMGASTALAADGARADWVRLFEDAGATGTLLVVDERDGRRHVHDPRPSAGTACRAASRTGTATRP
jgi:hypothetical protein